MLRIVPIVYVSDDEQIANHLAVWCLGPSGKKPLQKSGVPDGIDAAGIFIILVGICQRADDGVSLLRAKTKAGADKPDVITGQPAAKGQELIEVAVMEQNVGIQIDTAVFIDDLQSGIVRYKSPLFVRISCGRIRNAVNIEIVLIPFDDFIIRTEFLPACDALLDNFRFGITAKSAVVNLLGYHFLDLLLVVI